MSDNAPAASILELLTHPNPTVTEQKPKSKTNTNNIKWHCPKQLKKWDEFYDFDTFRCSFRGSLMQAALQGGRNLSHYPRMDPEVDCELYNEDDTKKLIHKWTESIVSDALRPIKDEFFPAIWRRGNLPPQGDVCEPPPRPESERTPPQRKCSDEARKSKPQSLRGLKPDSGTSSPYPRQAGSNSTTAPSCEERFPKEYKPATKWKSQWLAEYELVDESGEWVRGGTGDNIARPIKQAFTYCIRDMCRYGCILTCQEAFIFQVSPRDEEPVNSSRDPNVLRDRLIQNGLMEYITIPWASHGHGDLENHDTWTMNLALWFVHVLVGNDFQADWKYDPLVQSTSVLPPSLERRADPSFDTTSENGGGDPEMGTSGEESDHSDTEGSQESVPIMISPGMKRKRNSDAEEEDYVLSVAGSFSKRPTLER